YDKDSIMSYLADFIIYFFVITCEISSVSPTLFQKVPGYTLHGYILDSINVKSLGKCGESCATNPACFSFNFELGSKQKMSLCELLYCSLDANNSALVPNTLMTYYRLISEEATSSATPLCNSCVYAPCQNG
ncbi:unnamed protein product, partial [Owenia fusiformis]